jgi:hypothetical protein
MPGNEKAKDTTSIRPVRYARRQNGQRRGIASWSRIPWCASSEAETQIALSFKGRSRCDRQLAVQRPAVLRDA